MGYLGKLVNDKKIDNFEPVLLDIHGGDLNGFVLVRGGWNELNELRQTEEWIQWATEGAYLMEGFGVIDAFLGDDFEARMQHWGKVSKKFKK